MQTKKPISLGDKPPVRKLPRLTRRAARAIVRSQLPRHRRVLVHPVTVLVLLCAGVFIVGLTYKTLAASVIATARVAAPALTEGAVIINPVEGQTFTDVPITVEGTCPANSYVKLYRNSAFSGSAWCSSGNFTIETTLSDGINTLQAQDYNVTDSPGPAATPVNITFVPPAPLSTASSSTVTPSTTTPSTAVVSTVPVTASKNTVPLILSTEYSFQTFPIGGDFTWELEVLGGAPPYNVNTNWGDRTTTAIIIPTRQKFNISHKYKFAGYFPVKILTIDAHSNKTFLQLAALINVPGTAGFTTKQSTWIGQTILSTGFMQGLHQWLWLIWPSYLVVVLMIFSFWLGERQKVLKLVDYHYPTSHHR